MAQADLENIPRVLVDGFNSRNDNGLKFISDNAMWVDVPNQTVFKGKEGFRQFDQVWLTAFPDGKIEITNIIASGDRIVFEYIGRGTHTGQLKGAEGVLEPTGNTVELPLCDVLRIENGLIVEGRTYYDTGMLVRQLTEKGERGAA
jgi:predicted ester cyclase